MVIILIFGVNNSVKLLGDSGYFLSAGTTVSCSLFVISTIIAHVLGSKVSYLELISTALNILFLCVTGILEVTYSPSSGIVNQFSNIVSNVFGFLTGATIKIGCEVVEVDNDGLLAAGVLTLLGAGIFLIDLVFLVRSTRFKGF